ncbi:MAG: VWA domain-containing protein [Myxococcaceae bacterium]|nr:VWA domain-containing protein [Myxococcaceae bacterium]
MSRMPASNPSPSPYESSGGRLVAIDGRTLPLTGASLTADAKAGLVQVTLSQTFFNPHAEPLRVTYSLPLPADGAVSGFSFTIGDQRIVGEVDTKKQARQRFEDAVLEGRTAAILDQERTSLFTQEVGNVPPRLSVVCEVTIDQKLAWLPDGFWEWRFPTVVAPRYLGEPGRVADHAKVTVDVADRALPVKLSLGMTIRDRLADGCRPESPSHALHTVRGLQSTDVQFAAESGASLDRDVVVRWKAAQLKVGVELDVARPAKGAASEHAYGLLTLVPPSVEAKLAAVARDLIVLLDTSGSMSGQPLDQARRFTAALIDSLDDRDTLELIEFSSSPRRWKKEAVKATSANRRDAQGWLAKLRASGGTEMASGIIEALSPLRQEAQRQVVLITDGLIGSEHEVLTAIAHRLPSGSRVHTIGVGSGVNRSLTQPAARAGRGVELVMGLGEDVEVAIRRLLARTHQPLITDVELSGDALVLSAPQRLPDVFSGSPALLSMKLSPRGGRLVVRGRAGDGDFEETLEVPAVDRAQGSRSVATLFARELVEDLETQRVVEPGAQVDQAVQSLGLDFQISTRLTSWVAISEQMTVDPRLPRRNVTQPHELAYGMSAEGLGLRQPMAPMAGGVAPIQASLSAAPMRPGAPMPKSLASPTGAPRGGRADEGKREEAERPSLSRSRRLSEIASKDDSADDRSDSEVFDEAEFDGAPSGSFEPPAAAEPEPTEEQVKDKKAEPAPKKRPTFGLGGLVDKLVKAVTGAARQLTGRVLRQHGTRLDLEIVLDQQLDWTPAKDVVIELQNGTTVKAQVNFSFTTSSGVYGPGRVLTLTLTTPGEVQDPVRVQLISNGENVEITLRTP